MELFQDIKVALDDVGVWMMELASELQSAMGKLFSKPKLSDFQKEKLLHEFKMFYDLDGDGLLTCEDFEVARKHVCKLNGWPEGSKKEQNAAEVFELVWKAILDSADKDGDCQISSEEWLGLWEGVVRKMAEDKKRDSEQPEVADLPMWCYRYLDHRFQIYDRTGNGIIDGDEYEYVLEQFGVSPTQARQAWRIFTESNTVTVDFKTFCRLAVDYYFSSDPAALGNYITGKVDWESI